MMKTKSILDFVHPKKGGRTVPCFTHALLVKHQQNDFGRFKVSWTILWFQLALASTKSHMFFEAQVRWLDIEALQMPLRLGDDEFWGRRSQYTIGQLHHSWSTTAVKAHFFDMLTEKILKALS